MLKRLISKILPYRISLEENDFINEKTSKLNKFNNFNSFLEANDHRGFYHAMTLEELDYLGF